MKNRGIVPVFFLFVLAVTFASGMMVDYATNHVETKAERHQQQLE